MPPRHLAYKSKAPQHPIKQMDTVSYYSMEDEKVISEVVSAFDEESSGYSKWYIGLMHFLQLFSMLLLAFNYLGIRLFVLHGNTAFQFGLLRSLLSLVAVPVLTYQFRSPNDATEEITNEATPVTRRWWSVQTLSILILILCGALRQMLLPISLMWNSISSIGVVQPASPVFTTLFAVLLKAETGSWMTLLAVFICFCGLFIAEEAWNLSALDGSIILLLLIPMSKGLQIVQTQLLPNLSPSKIQFFQIIGLCALCVPTFFFVELVAYSGSDIEVFWERIKHLSGAEWAAVLYSVIAVMFVSWRIQILGVKSLGSIAVSVYQCSQPIFAFLLAYIFLDESFSVSKLCGSAVICLGLILNLVDKCYRKNAGHHTERNEKVPLILSGYPSAAVTRLPDSDRTMGLFTESLNSLR